MPTLRLLDDASGTESLPICYRESALALNILLSPSLGPSNADSEYRILCRMKSAIRYHRFHTSSIRHLRISFIKRGSSCKPSVRNPGIAQHMLDMMRQLMVERGISASRLESLTLELPLCFRLMPGAGAESLRAAIREMIRENTKLKIVLKIDSPGAEQEMQKLVMEGLIAAVDNMGRWMRYQRLEGQKCRLFAIKGGNSKGTVERPLNIPEKLRARGEGSREDAVPPNCVLGEDPNFSFLFDRPVDRGFWR